MSGAYKDFTAGIAINRVERERKKQEAEERQRKSEKKRNKLIATLKNVADVSGYEIVNRIEIRDKKTGEIYK